MSIRKHSYSTRDGKPTKTANYYVFFSDHAGARRRVPAYVDKTASKELERLIQALVAHRATGAVLRPELARKVDRLKPQTLEQLVKWRILDASRLAALKPIAELLNSFKESLESGDRDAKHVRQVFAMASRVVEGIGARNLGDINAHSVERCLREMREGDGSVRAQTSNHYLAAIKQFCSWAVARGLLAANPVRHVKKLNASLDRALVRRALSLTELRRLLTATEAGGEHHGLTGIQRSLIYRLALETGLRANELATLKVSSFDLDQEPRLRLAAKNAKNRKDSVIPLRPALAQRLKEAVQGLGAWDPVFPVHRSWRSSEMLKADLRTAGVPVADDEGRIADFHALRHTFVSNAFQAGGSPKTVQEAARHSTPMLTVGTYAHSGDNDLRDLLNALPDLDGEPDSAEAMRATGTDGAAQMQLPVLVPGLVPEGAEGGRAEPPQTGVWRRCRDLNPGSVARRQFSKLLH